MPYTRCLTGRAGLVVTIRKTLLIAFLLAGLLPSLLIALLAFGFAGHALHAEIEQSLRVQAATVALDVDKMLFERLQNAQIWRRLEVMQELAVGDVDKRLAKFLAETRDGYRDVYTELACADPSGRIVASSAPSDRARVLAPDDESTTGLADDPAIRLEHLRFLRDGGSPVLPIDAEIRSDFDQHPLGRLQLSFDWGQVLHILDQAGTGGREVLLVDRDGRVIAASAAPRTRGLIGRTVPAAWLADGVSRRSGELVGSGEVTVGGARSQGYGHYVGFGWTTLVVQPVDLAFRPVREMALVFAALLALASSGVALFATGVAGRIARPITALTRYTRSWRGGSRETVAPSAGPGEVGELTSAFVETLAALDASRGELVRAGQLAALGELAAMMAHEIRTPIGILRSSAQILAREPALSSEGRELTGFIASETERLNRLVTTLLDGTRNRAPNPIPTDLADLAQQAVGLLGGQAAKAGVGLALAADGTVPASCDPEQITQVMLNLMQNALQIVPAGGRVLITPRRDGAAAVVEVADDGPGIPEAELPRVFEPFFTRRDGGLGLGLAVVRQILDAHGGRIVAGRSALGGALFRIELPAAEGPT